MSAEYNIIIRGANGTKRAEVSDFQTLSYTKRVNEPGLLAFRLTGSHAAVAELEHNGQVEVRRRINGSWYTDFYGLYRGYSQKQPGQTYVDITCPGQMTFLADEHIAYYANTISQNG